MLGISFRRFGLVPKLLHRDGALEELSSNLMFGGTKMINSTANVNAKSFRSDALNSHKRRGDVLWAGARNRGVGHLWHLPDPRPAALHPLAREASSSAKNGREGSKHTFSLSVTRCHCV